MSAVLFAIISMLGFGLANSFSKYVAAKESPERNIFFRSIASSTVLLLALVIFHTWMKIPLGYLLLGFGLALASYLPPMFFYKALSHEKLGIVSPITNSAIVITVILSAVFFRERLSGLQILSMAIVFLGIILVSYRAESGKRVGKGIIYSVYACVLWGLFFFLFKIPSDALGPFLMAFVIETGVMVSASAHTALGNGFKLPKWKVLGALILIGIFTACGTLFYTLGISTGDVSIVAAIAFSSPAVAVLAGAIFFNERLSMLQYAAAATIILGIVGLSV